MSHFDFPPGFLWGAAASSHQVEGNNQWNDWWEYEQSGQLPHRSGDACRHYELYEQDFDLARSWGHNAHRFSIEWSRIEPSEGKWNAGALDHYRSVVRALKQRDLEPVLTLHHFTNPAWFTRRGGWLRSDSAMLFARYAAYVIEKLGAEVKYWLTVNEPTVYVWQGYVRGEWPPCRKNSWIASIRVLMHLAKAHVAAYHMLHRYGSNILVGFAHNAPLITPCDPERKGDRVASWLRDFFWNRAFFHMIGAKVCKAAISQCLDFIGINYYTRSIVRSSGLGIGALFGKVCRLSHHSPCGPVSDIGWEIYPSGLQTTLERFSQFGLPLLVTENGVATNDEELRRDFLVHHLLSLAQAIAGGVNVIGYLYWTLIDNFEWTMGTGPHFGLASVNRKSEERKARPCVHEFSRVCRENRIEYS